MRREVVPAPRQGPLGAVTAVAAVLACVVASVGCKRDADAPLTQAQLFPDAEAAKPTATVSAQSPQPKAEQVAETEPNDAPTEAQPVAANALIDGRLGQAEALAGAAPPIDKPRGKKGPKIVQIDADWYRLPAVPPGHVAQIDLRTAPPCAELELYDHTGKTLVRKARASKTARPAIPSLGAAAQASLVRVVCRGKAGEAGGPYRLAIYTRPARPDEEVEPNDKPRPDLLALTVGTTLQGTLAPAEDVDLYALQLGSRPPGELVLLSVAGVPDVELVVQLVDAATGQVLLQRKPGKGEGVVVPDLDTARLGDRTLLRLQALSGANPDTLYAVGVQTYLPPGCTSQFECARLLPSEREPNDDAAQGSPIVAGTAASGVLDGPGDVDWLEATAPAPNAPTANKTMVAAVQLQGPAALVLGLQLGAGQPPVQVWAGKPGEALQLTGLQADATSKLHLAVRAQKDGWNRTEAWRLQLQWLEVESYEQESGDEATQPLIYAPSHAMQAVAAGLDLAHGGWRRSGALLPGGDRDGFGLDLRQRPGPTGAVLVCGGDGLPGLTCAIQDPGGREVAKAPGDGTAEVALPPGNYKVVVKADPPRPSRKPYVVTVREEPGLAVIPEPVTPTDSAIEVP